MIEYVPSLPSEKLNVIHRMPVGNITKVIVTYKTSFWRTVGFSGEAVTYGGSSIINGLDHGPLCIIFDGITSKGSPALVGFIGGQQQIQYASVEADDRKRAVLHSLSELFGKQALDPIDYKEKNWDEEPYNHGGPVSVATPGIGTSITAGLREPFGRLHFAGTESATVWCGFINGAVQSGYRAANEILYHLRPQVITASDLEDTNYIKRTRVSKSRKHGGTILHWVAVLALAGGVFYLIRNRALLTNF
ncbi:hypothetical protein LSH36_205g02007 [Paralvinella palmiformis]|uniref:Amine oxidase n=1 Tax=Paralvinella palmiformis TaxID=53620 RepID=A0AAD9N6G4_9ANNE|nr:hypothetical protein LSH36_205g02007 [Paralvinella palmiformis]